MSPKTKKNTKNSDKPCAVSIKKTENAESKSNIFRRLYIMLKEKTVKLSQKPTLFLFVIAFALTVVMETLSRHSLFSAVMFIFKNPVAFMLGISIIMATYLPSLLFKRRYAVIVFITALWLSMNITDFIMRFFRMTPFSAMDITLLTSVASIISLYLGIVGAIVIALAIIGAIALVIFMFVKAPKSDFPLKARILSGCKIAVIFAVMLFTAIQSGAITGKFTNLVTAYDQYGFTYCFTASIFSRGITKPTGYSQATIEEIDNKLTGTGTNTASKTDPNVILIQMESFFDLNYLTGIEFSQNPVPNFTELKKTCPHGALTVPSLGAGTANTEFEVLTGMDKSDFGIGEYPYKTILQNMTCESICYNLKKSSYTTHAIHNHYGTFYDRNKVFQNLGFDTFTPVECMTYVPTTPIGWEKDEILPTYIDAALKSTEGRDFVFAITVQDHGKYPLEPMPDYTPTITTGTSIEDIAYRSTMEYYASMVYETDAMIAKLTEMYKDSDEPVMIVFYGDHLPNITLTEDDIITGDLLSTEYVVWTNYDLKPEKQEQDLMSYQLTAYMMQLCGKTDGIITNIHQTYMDTKNPLDYSYVLELIEYDMLYGDNYINEAEREKLEPTDMRIGIFDINIKGVDTNHDEESGEITNTVHGNNFTAWSVVYINGEPKRTIFKDSKTLIINDTELLEGDIICVKQVAQNKAVLTETEEYIF